jgi:hypothetical protein
MAARRCGGRAANPFRARSSCSCAATACVSRLARSARGDRAGRAQLAALHRTDEDLAEMTRIHRQLEQVSDDVDEHVRLNLHGIGP